ncbi:hypothetical protein OAA99_02175 [Omnitrophica bacterium]|nr:hypothetical protein [Candidatus Omnitrophota bacterium]
MKPLKVLLSVFVLSFIYVGAGFSLSDEYVEVITEDQPIAVGAVFFTKSTPRPGYKACYTHMGFEGNNIRVKYELYYHHDELEESDIFTLVTSTNRQTVLSTEPLCDEDPSRVTKLLITVIDGFGRIGVDEYKGR